MKFSRDLQTTQLIHVVRRYDTEVSKSLGQISTKLRVRLLHQASSDIGERQDYKFYLHVHKPYM